MAMSIRDVAKAASISCETILEVLVSPSALEPEVVRFVMQTIRDTGYLDTFSRWKTGRTETSVAVLVPTVDSPSAVEFFRGIDRALSALGMSVSLPIFPTRHAPAYVDEIANRMLSFNAVEAVLAIDLEPSAEILDAYAGFGKPIVLLEEKSPKAQSVLIENQRGVGIGMNYLYNKGYRTIGLLNGPSAKSYRATIPSERLIGYLTSLHRLGLPFDESLVFEASDYDADSGARGFRYFSERGALPDAVFCVSGDMSAIGFVDAARAAGVRVPEDIAVLGYDDLPVARFVSPALSTIRQRLMIAGAGALVLALEAAVNGRGEDLVIVPELVTRGSA